MKKLKMIRNTTNISKLQIKRWKFSPTLPNVFMNGIIFTKIVKGKSTKSKSHQSKLKKIFENTYGLPEVTFKKKANATIAKKAIKVAVVFSGGQAPGGHNVIAGIFDGLKKVNKKNILIGYLGGPTGILENKFKIISKNVLKKYRNTGGFDLIQSGRAKIETYEQFGLIKKNFLKNKIDALVIVGGDDSNTNAAMIAEYVIKEKLNKCIVGIPKTIDGDLKNKYIETSFGFDTATKIYSELVGNICKDVNSSQKHWHFIRLMGRSASHVALEVGFKTQPNIVLIGEEVLAKNMTLFKIIENITDIIVKRSEAGKDFGVVLVPEGLIEFIPEIKKLTSALNDVLHKNSNIISKFYSLEEKKNFIYNKIPNKLSDLMISLPLNIASQLISDRDPHGNINVSQIETEKLLIEMVYRKLFYLKKKNKYKGKFSPISHFFGYEGRCGAPSNFDANYTYALGYSATTLVLNKLTGYLSYVKNLTRPPKQWKCGGIPLTAMMSMEKRNNKNKPVIQKTLVNLNGNVFKKFIKNRNKWAIGENYISPGPIQYFGPSDITDITTKTLQYECFENNY
ncbi:MAG: diphosphate--fructose-6-phosphate 1-phosphotransferase [Endomicrobium sp.]|jgi:pyrophosphate--fructose-6-phosphate 1-phosphotransferase|nr:diphosphate--fructose-6-phosphate 1-phosphotransferase [Endomicrobium sp.]